MQDDVFNRFLYESESDSLDFKRDQYRFSRASDDDKAELLKDVLSMANSWRRTEGFIVLGIIDKPEKPNELHGITEHIDDSQLQEFVNSKTNRICEFAYSTHTVGTKTFGILRFPIQERPVYLKKNYGKLKKETVYVRRGSSTGEAQLDEVSKMGHVLTEEKRYPAIEVNFFDHDAGVSLGKDISVEAFHVEISDSIPDYREGMNGGTFSINLGTGNADFYRDLYNHLDFITSFRPIYFHLVNSGSIEANNLKIEITVNDRDVEIKADGDESPKPEKNRFASIRTFHAIASHSIFHIEKKLNRTVVLASIKSLHAKQDSEIDGTLYIKPVNSGVLTLHVKVFCDNVESPFMYQLTMNVKHLIQRVSWGDYRNKLLEKGILFP